MTTYSVGAEPRFFALVPCAGTGSRAGTLGPKQYQPVAGRPMVAHTLAALAEVARLEATLVVLAPDDEQFEEDLPGLAGERLWLCREGGASRAETVANGLNVLRERGAQPHDWVLVHDAARCLVRPEWVDRLIDECRGDEVGGLLALPLADTIKDEVDGRVGATVDRRGKWAAQTPQMFRLGLLAPALAFTGEEVTDEASAVEALGHRPRLVRGDWENLKVTFPPDFALAERLMGSRVSGPQLRPVLPARDFETTQQFYLDLGFTREFAMGELAGFVRDRSGFLLQRASPDTPVVGLELHLTVDDLASFWHGVQSAGIAARYGVIVTAPQTRPWGRQDMALTDPSGVRWTISQRMENAA